jgi:hypothetical protein
MEDVLRSEFRRPGKLTEILNTLTIEGGECHIIDDDDGSVFAIIRLPEDGDHEPLTPDSGTPRSRAILV